MFCIIDKRKWRQDNKKEKYIKNVCHNFEIGKISVNTPYILSNQIAINVTNNRNCSIKIAFWFKVCVLRNWIFTNSN